MSTTFAKLWSSLCANYQRNERDLNYAYGGAQNVRFFSQLYSESEIAKLPVRQVVLTNVCLEGTDCRDRLTNEAKRSKTFHAVLVLATSISSDHHWIHESIFAKTMFSDAIDAQHFFTLREKGSQLPHDEDFSSDEFFTDAILDEAVTSSSDEDDEDVDEAEREVHDNFRKVPKPFQRPLNTAPLKWLTEVYHSFYNNFFQDIRRLQVSNRIVNPPRPELLYC